MCCSCISPQYVLQIVGVATHQRLQPAGLSSCRMSDQIWPNSIFMELPAERHHSCAGLKNRRLKLVSRIHPLYSPHCASSSECLQPQVTTSISLPCRSQIAAEVDLYIHHVNSSSLPNRLCVNAGRAGGALSDMVTSLQNTMRCCEGRG